MIVFMYLGFCYQYFLLLSRVVSKNLISSAKSISRSVSIEQYAKVFSGTDITVM